MLQDDSEFAMLQRIAEQTASPPKTDEPKLEPVETEVSAEWLLPGFGPKSRVMTSFGAVPIEALRRRDPVKTHNGRFIEVQFVDELRLDRRFLIDHPEAQPISLPRGAMGAGCPAQDMFASGGQKIRIPGRFDQDAGTVASEFVGRGGIARKSHGYFTYYVFHCGEPCTVNVDGLWVDIDPSVLGGQTH